jgi:HD superfamily phosphodiesterase
MASAIETLKSNLLEYCAQSKQKDGYDFWDEHIKFVARHAKELAQANGADAEVCELAALGHDISMPAGIGPREEHEKYSAEITKEILAATGYPSGKPRSGRRLHFASPGQQG